MLKLAFRLVALSALLVVNGGHAVDYPVVLSDDPPLLLAARDDNDRDYRNPADSRDQRDQPDQRNDADRTRPPPRFGRGYEDREQERQDKRRQQNE
jgi:hypothetical protein